MKRKKWIPFLQVIPYLLVGMWDVPTWHKAQAPVTLELLAGDLYGPLRNKIHAAAG